MPTPSPVAPVKPELLRWACDRAIAEEQDALYDRFPRLSAWLAGDGNPTLADLEEIARATGVAVGYLFLPEPPVFSPPTAFEAWLATYDMDAERHVTDDMRAAWEAGVAAERERIAAQLAGVAAEYDRQAGRVVLNTEIVRRAYVARDMLGAMGLVAEATVAATIRSPAPEEAR